MYEPPLQILALNELLNFGNTVKFNVTTLSQPPAVVNVAVYVPVVVLAMPLNIYELPLQMFALNDELNAGNTVKFSVTTLSQPVELINVAVYEPVVVLAIPLNIYELPLQILALNDELSAGRTVKFRVTTLSHPFAAVNVAV